MNTPTTGIEAPARGADSPGPGALTDRWIDLLWLLLALVVFAIAAGLAYRPSVASATAVVLTICGPVVLVGMVVVLLRDLAGVPDRVVDVAVILTLVAWSLLILDDDRWSIVTFALYGVVFSTGRVKGIALAVVLTVIWGVGWTLDGAPLWTLIIPTGVLGAGTLISLSLYHSARVNDRQAELIEQLRDAQRDLAASERSKGALQERARMAGEIHDTLAQGFTSIVLLSRAAGRAGDPAEALTAIEDTAQDNLVAARRLIDAMRPSELDSASLPDAIDRQLTAALPDDVRAELRLVGRPRQLPGSVEVTMLRAAQEALTNVGAHANAGRVDVTLSYLDDLVALDVRDDGVGFTPGQVTDRGSLTGGQGLEVLRQRVDSLSGELTIESGGDVGSVVSVLLPTGPA